MNNCIKMFDCPEIQDDWEPKVEDWFAENWYVKRGWEPPKRLVCDAYSSHKLNAEIIVCQRGHHWNRNRNKLIYLPTIEQLMEMVAAKGYTHWALNIFYDFSNFISGKRVKIEYIKQFIKPQELWLAFVMHELHGKKRKNEEWI